MRDHEPDMLGWCGIGKNKPMEVVEVKLIYIYVLVDEKVFEASGGNVIKSALYVGKGTGARMDEHLREARASLEDETRIDSQSNPAKVKALVEMLKAGKQVKAFRISAGYSTDNDAYIAEALAITLINSTRAEGNKLLNAVAGHHSVDIADMATHFLFAGSADMELPTKSVEKAVLVKTTDKESGTVHYAPSKRERWVYKGNPVDGVVVMRAVRDKKPRREWDPMRPWSNDEAVDRARHYWPFGKETIMGWLKGQDRPRYLFAAVPDGAKSVVRYIWEIDWTKELEFHPFEKGGGVGKWGFSLLDGESKALKACREKYLGKWLVEEREGRAGKTQVLSGYTAGVRVIGI